MKLSKRTLLTAAISVLAATTGFAATWTGVDRLPGREPVRVKVDGEKRAYFRATPRVPLDLTLEGPLRLRVISRVELPQRTQGAVSYGLRVSTGNRLLERQRTEALPSTEARLGKTAGTLAQSRQMIVDVPGGSHHLTVSVEGRRPVLLRLLTGAPVLDEERSVGLLPVEPSGRVLLRDEDKTVPYYTVRAGSPVRFEVAGPTTLELISRLDFDTTMRGAQSYRLAISTDGQRPSKVDFNTTKALTATYVELPDRVPSKLRRLELPIGPGPHAIAVDLVRPTGGSVQVRARLPQSAGEPSE